MNNRNLLIIFVILLVIYGITRLGSNKREGSFDANLITLDTTQINNIVIKTKGEENEISLKREGDAWLVSNGQISTQAVPSAIESILGNLANIQTTRIATKDAEKWKDYEVEDENGTRIKVYQDNKLLEDFIVGRFNFNQQTRSGTSYVRLADKNEVYAVDGFLTLTFGQGFDSYRDRSILKLPPEQEIVGLSFQAPEASYQLGKLGDQWQINGTEPADSAAVASYLNVLRNVSGNTFADDFDGLKASEYAFRSVAITANNSSQPHIINCYLDTTRTEPFIINSSQHPDVFFASDTTGVYERVFKDVKEFQIAEE